MVEADKPQATPFQQLALRRLQYALDTDPFCANASYTDELADQMYRDGHGVEQYRTKKERIQLPLETLVRLRAKVMYSSFKDLEESPLAAQARDLIKKLKSQSKEDLPPNLS